MRKELEKKVDRAIKLIQSASKIALANGCPSIEVAYSGGKDSDVILELTKMSGVPYRAIYKNTTIDPPGTIKHVREKGVEVMQPQLSFFKLIEKKGLPNKLRRFCCTYLKEYKVLDYAIVGVRREESVKRSNMYKEPEMCRVYNKNERCRQYFPILDWNSRDVEDFIMLRGIKCHPLYYDDNGAFHVERRLGCIGCVMLDKKRIESLKLHPKFIKSYACALRKYRESHPMVKSNSLFKDEYAHIVHDLFYWRKPFSEWLAMNNDSLFSSMDYKSFLEDYFGVLM